VPFPVDEANDDRHFIFVKSLLQSNQTAFLSGLGDSASAATYVLESSLKIVNRRFFRNLKRIFSSSLQAKEVFSATPG
jgi:hypothetical protein